MSNFDLAIMAVDPGLTTGVAQGVFTIGDPSGMVPELLAVGRGMRTFEISNSEIEEHWEVSAAIEIVKEWRWFRNEWPSCEHRLVLEDWTARLPLRSAGRVVLSPARIASCVEGLLANQEIGRAGEIKYQRPADAKTYATDRRLKEWKLWVKGSDHQRDANRHLALALLKETI